MSYCGECYYQGKKLKPCSTCYCGSEAKTEWTNADRIRSMTDEELAKFASHYISCGYCDANYGKCGGRCEETLLKWLQSEAE